MVALIDVNDYGIILGALGLVSGIASAAYARGQVVAARAQLQDAREQAIETLRAAELVAENARQQATEALCAAELVAENARTQAEAALLAAELLARSDISARIRAMRTSNLHSNPSLPPDMQALIERAGGANAYSVLVDAMEAAQEVFFLRKRGTIADGQWRRLMQDDMPLVVGNPAFEEAFRRAAIRDVLVPEFVEAFEPLLGGRAVFDPARAADRPT